MSICSEYSKRVGTEVAWGHILLRIKLKECIEGIIPEYKENFRVLNKQAQKASYKQSIIYLLTLFEGFMHDFIIEKENIIDEKINIKHLLVGEEKKWKSLCKKNLEYKSKSCSFMNIQYSLFILKERYNIEYPDTLTHLVLELGSLRNCIVHHNGDISKYDKEGEILFKNTLNRTISFLQMDNNSNDICKYISDEYMNLIIFDLQKFIDMCEDKN